MSKGESEAREKIIAAATALIVERGSVEKITTRDIAAQAGVGVGLINYHFQSKERLIELCVQRFIGGVIAGFRGEYLALDGMPPLDKLKLLLRRTAGFLALNPSISEISIKTDLNAAHPGDNTTQTIAAYLPVVREVCGDGRSEQEQRVLLASLVAAVQSAFLRREVLREEMGIDFALPEHRGMLIDTIVDALFD